MRTRYPQSFPYQQEREQRRNEIGARGVGEDSDYESPSGQWRDEQEVPDIYGRRFGHRAGAGSQRQGGGQRGGQRGEDALRPAGRRGYREEETSRYGGEDYTTDPFGRDEPRFGGAYGEYESERGGGRDFDEAPYDQSYALRRGFGRDKPGAGAERGGPRAGESSSRAGSGGRSQPGHWGADQGDLRSTLASGSSSGYGVNAGGQAWSDVARDRKGPRGYVRSDERIREFICERLAQHHRLDVSDVGVEVSNGCVTLEGTVPERSMKYAIEETADNCWGVRDVENHIRVAPRGGWRGGEGGAWGGQGQAAGVGASEADPQAVASVAGGQPSKE
ncbi:BON domain-containing protein [Azoarcus sp. TTM-91]|uniref:BON domain-containing protein n=1 Tax=Azoarcus sp. TTM-91 TaxID=2691581 RepID=UPI001B7CFD43|nr:BON domain-containing protein [Azoarcus sp. TTM-91]